MVEGLVQGVGFRPFIYRLAKKHQLAGNVSNRTDGVLVNVNGEESVIDLFINEIETLAPPAAYIRNISQNTCSDFLIDDFVILSSQAMQDQITEISPDIAVCSDCLADLKKQERRKNYPFINCTNCGPRFSIIKKLPYDRINTTMHQFQMCNKCSEEYHHVLDRRFHAQPVACNHCGPVYIYNARRDFNEIVNALVIKIQQGKIVAVKGLGGYNLICDAQNNKAVTRLRQIKGRDTKPFAVMFNELHTAKGYCYMSDYEEKVISSWRRPIVILKQRRKLCDSVNNGLGSIGAMLPYLPFHYVLFRKLSISAIVYTSANISGEPIISDDQFAYETYNKKVDALVSHNREIHNPIDDSVVKIAHQKIQIVRRARGFVPNPIPLSSKVESIFAAGAELKNSFAIGKGQHAILSQYTGDLKNLETYTFYKKTVNQFFDLFQFKPHIIACDLHPDYLSTQFSESLNQGKLNGSHIPMVKVQHHHAHIVSCMAENQINQKVIGVSFDGTGYGTDGNIWGGEFLVCDTKSFDRLAHFDYASMPGGDIAADEPWRMALSYLNHYNINSKPDIYTGIDQNKLAVVSEMIRTEINSPITSSVGRLFDAVSFLVNKVAKNSFDAEGPMRLESIADKAETDAYSFSLNDRVIVLEKMFHELIADLDQLSPSRISAKFHNTMVEIVCNVAKKIRSETGINKVVLSGGVFQNSFLLEKSIENLEYNQFTTFTNHLVPPNDGGIALGQLIVASNYL